MLIKALGEAVGILLLLLLLFVVPHGGMEFGRSFVAARLDDELTAMYAGNSTASLRQAPTSRIRDA
jgi:hypothetical protein